MQNKLLKSIIKVKTLEKWVKINLKLKHYLILFRFKIIIIIIQWSYWNVFNVNKDCDASEYDSWWYIKIYTDRYIHKCIDW